VSQPRATSRETYRRSTVSVFIAGACFSGAIFGSLSLRDAFAHEPSECPVCSVCATCLECAPPATCPECSLPAPSPEQVQAVQRALEAIQAVEVGEDLPLGAPPPPRDSPL